MCEEAPDRHLREAQLTARADGLWRVEDAPEPKVTDLHAKTMFPRKRETETALRLCLARGVS